MAKQRQISKRHLELMNCDSYLFSVEEISLLLRKNRVDTEILLKEKNIPFTVEKKKVVGKMKDVKMYRHYHIRELIEKREVIYA